MRKVIIALMALMTFTGVSAQESSLKEKMVDGRIYLNKEKSIYIGESMIAAGYNFGIGMPDCLDKSNGHSEFIAWDLASVNFSLKDKRHTLSAGFGMSWNKYATSDKGCFYKNTNNLVVADRSLESVIDYSRFLTYSLNIPLMYRYTANNRLYVAAGTVLNINLYGSIYNEYSNHDYDVYTSTTIKNVHQNPFTVDLRFEAGYKDVGLFVKYSPMNVIQADKGPEFRSFGIGIAVRP